MGTELPIIRSILAVPGLVLRRDWLRVQIRERPLSRMVHEFSALCESAEALDPLAREALVAWVALLICDGDSPWLIELRRLAHEASHHSLERLLRSYSVPSFISGAGEDDFNPALGRELTVGERRSLARQPHRNRLNQLLLDPHPLVVRQLLINPRLTENDVVALAAQRPARATTLRTLAEFPNWVVRTRVRMTLVSNPLTPSCIAIPLTALATRPELTEIADSPNLHIVLRVVAQELLERRPPLGSGDVSTLQ